MIYEQGIPDNEIKQDVLEYKCPDQCFRDLNPFTKRSVFITCSRFKAGTE